MTPKRKAYIVGCSKRELWVRRLIKTHKKAIKGAKELLENGCFNSDGQEAVCKSAMQANKWLVACFRHELARLKGMDRVVVPKFRFAVDEFKGGRYTGKKVYYGYCGCGKSVNSDDKFCYSCGRKILWKKVK